MIDGVDDFLKGSEPETEQVETETPEVAETPQPEPKDDRPRDEHGRFAPKGETQPETPEPSAPPALEEQHTIPPKALQEERRKRQELEQQLNEIRQQMASQQQPQQPRPDFWEDQEGYLQHYGEQILTQAEQRALARFEERLIARSANAARAKYEDFDDTVAVFADMAKANPALEAQLRQHENPGEFVYTTAKTQMELAQYGGDMSALIEAKVRAELEKAQAQQPKPEPAPQPQIPETLAGAQSAKSGTIAAGPPTLDSILGRK